MSDIDRVRALTQSALDEFDNIVLSVTLRRCIRIAHLRGDWRSLTWLELEGRELGPSRPRDDTLARELADEFGIGDYHEARIPIIEAWIARRTERDS